MVEKFLKDSIIKIKKVGFEGSFGVGKSATILGAMGKLKSMHFNVEMIPEVIRECPFPADLSAGADTQYWILKTQMQKEIDVSKNFPDFIFCDRCVLSMVVYGSLLFEEGKLSEKELRLIVRLARDWISSYTCFVLVAPIKSEEVFDDGFRRTDRKAQLALHNRFEETLKLMGVPFTVVSGEYDERIKETVSFLRDLKRDNTEEETLKKVFGLAKNNANKDSEK
ncbi:MAG: ATP-binding protein [Candidatus Diapherotrites archaeon]|nr:ATP-binding protein [Candidatus Diapherotrites archaeon]